MLHRIMPAGFQDVEEADQIGFDIDLRMVDGIAHPRLGGEVHNHRRPVFGEDPVHKRLIRQIPPDESVPDR